MNLQQSGMNGASPPTTPVSMTPNDIDPPSAMAIFITAIALLLGAYTLVFAVTLPANIGESLKTALSNVVPLALLAATTYVGLHRFLLPRGVLFQASGHLLLAPTFSASWYLLTIVAQALMRVTERGGFVLGQFSGLALVWQLFQGLVLYALVASITYALRGGRLASPVQLISASEPLERYLTRCGDELVPVEVDDIVLIRGAQDYAEVITTDSRAHLVRMSLADFEARLPRQRFVRVHRSAIVNLAHLGRAEPIGSGRIALHMSGGQTVETSRSGAQTIRQTVL